ILVVEDNEEVRANLAEILEIYGYVVTEAANGLEGVKQAIESPPDIILCDVMMPELDGFGVLNLLSEHERTAGIPFVFITAKTEAEDIRRGMNLGADDYITKPFYKDELLNVINVRLKKAAKRSATAPPPAAPTPTLSDPARGRSAITAAFTKHGREETFKQGENIVREGDYPHFLYRVKSGHVHLARPHAYGRDYVIAELSQEEIFGLPTCLERTTFHYTAKVVSKTASCSLLPVATLYKLINSDRSVSEAIMQLLASRVVEQSEKLVHQAYDSVRRRTALVLCDLHEKYEGGAIQLSRDELAQMVGSTKESVIRALSDFKREKLVKTEGRALQIEDPERLRGLLV
ncbi:MAG: response regulator, partial [Bacteroidota bacterium]